VSDTIQRLDAVDSGRDSGFLATFWRP